MFIFISLLAERKLLLKWDNICWAMRETVFITGYIFHSARIGHRIQRFSGRVATGMFSGGFTQLHWSWDKRSQSLGRQGRICAQRPRGTSQAPRSRKNGRVTEHLTFNIQTIYIYCIYINSFRNVHGFNVTTISTYDHPHLHINTY